MTPLFPTGKLVGAEAPCSEQMAFSVLPPQGRQVIPERKRLSRDSVSAIFLFSLMSVALACVLAPRSYAQTHEGAEGGTRTQSAAVTASNANQLASIASETDETSTGIPSGTSTVTDSEISPAVAKQLAAMQAEIEALKTELRSRNAVTSAPPPAVTSNAAVAMPDPKNVESASLSASTDAAASTFRHARKAESQPIPSPTPTGRG